MLPGPNRLGHVNVPVAQVSLISALQNFYRIIFGQGAGDSQTGFALQQLHKAADMVFVHKKEQDIQTPAWLASLPKLVPNLYI